MWLGCTAFVISGLSIFFGFYRQPGWATEMSIVHFTFGAIAALASFTFCLRVRAPVSLDIYKVDTEWFIALERSCLKPTVRRLWDLEAFQESFGFDSSSVKHSGFRGRHAGFTTSKTATLHLFFAASGACPALRMAISLEDPFAFFTKLRDVMTATEHGLMRIARDYVADWDADTSTVAQSARSARPPSFQMADKSGKSCVGA